MDPGHRQEKEANMPTDRDLQVISPKHAREIFGLGAGRLDGVTFMQTDPMQFLHHYFHFVVGASSTYKQQQVGVLTLLRTIQR